MIFSFFFRKNAPGFEEIITLAWYGSSSWLGGARKLVGGVPCNGVVSAIESEI